MTDPSGTGPGWAPRLQALEYPQEYVFKVMGLAGDDFAEHVRSLLSRVVPGVTSEQVVVRASRGGKYHSASVTARLDSEAQRRAVYEALRADGRVVYYL